MLLNCGLLTLFVIDPFGVLDLPGLAQGSERPTYVVFLADDGNLDDQRRYFAAHPGIEVTHRGTVLNTILVRFRGDGADPVRQLRQQPFVSMVARGSNVICR